MNADCYYDVVVDPWTVSRWFLGSPLDPAGNEVDAREFTYGNVLGPQPLLSLPIYQRGEKVDFNFAAFDMIVTPTTLNEELEKIAGSAIQRFPVTVEGCAATEFEILNVCNRLACLDEKRSYFERWTEAHGRPDKVGGYRIVRNMHIDRSVAEGHHIFRLEGWRVVLIVSDAVKQLFDSRRVTGIAFQPIS